MAHAARPAPCPEPTHAAARSTIASLLALGLALVPCRALAEAAPTSSADVEEPAAEPSTDPADETTVEAEAEADEPALEPGPGEDAQSQPDPADDALHEAEPEPDEDDAEPDEADESADDENDASKTAAQGEPLRPLQTAAWWTMFGAFSVGTTAGVLAGLAERQEDRATRLSTLFDASTGAQPQYAERQDEYEGYLRRGQAYERAAIGVGVIAGLTTITAITLFAIDARRQRGERAPRKRAAWRTSPGGVEVRF